MTLHSRSEVLGLLVPALHRRAYLTARAVALECTHTERRRYSPWGTFARAVRIGREVLLALCGVTALLFWLLVLVGFLW